MKKIIITFIIIFITFFGIFLKNPDVVYAAESEINYNKTGLGYTINAVKNEYIDIAEIRTGSPIFNESWLDEKIANIVPDSINESTVHSYSSSNFRDINLDINLAFGLSESVAGIYDIFTGNAKLGFNLGANIHYKDYISQYYYTLQCNFDRYAYALPNYSSNLTDYRNHLHEDYLKKLNEFLSSPSSEKAEQFFDMYGTHLIAKGIYGGKLEVYYSAVSNKVAVGGKYKASITNEVNAGVMGLIEGGVNFNYSLAAALDISSELYKDSFVAKVRGGNPFPSTSLTSFNINYANWTETIDSKPSLIRTSSDGLIPLWNLLPDQYNTTYYQNLMFNYFKSYANSFFPDAEYDNTVVLAIPCEMEKYRPIRTETYTITDLGRWDQPHDVIDLNNFAFYTPSIFEAEGFKTATILIKMEMREIDKGYQYICIYDDLCDNLTDEQKDSHKIKPDIQYEYCGTSLGSTFGVVVFTFDNIPISKLANAKFLDIRYGASGSKDDDWQNRNLEIKINYYK